MATRVRIPGTDIDQSLEDGDWPNSLVEAIESALLAMKENPGDVDEEITLVLVNDFEPEEDEDEEEEETMEEKK